MIVMDLEWNRGYDSKPIDEILQIGAVRTDESGAIRDTFSVFVSPAIHKKFDRGARSLPDLEDSKSSDISFPEAWGMFEAWRGEDNEYAFWGVGDFETVRQNCAYYGLCFTEPSAVYDYQSAFSHALGQGGQQAALWRVIDYLGVPDVFTYHNALNDAMYTALVGSWLGEAAKYIKPESDDPKRKREKFCTEPYTAAKGKRVGPFASTEDCLNSRVARSPACPVCGKSFWIRQWHTTDSVRFFGTGSCPDHGKFIARLTLDPETLLGRLAVPELDPTAIYEYRRVCRRGTTHVCASLHKGGRRRFARRRRAG